MRTNEHRAPAVPLDRPRFKLLRVPAGRAKGFARSSAANAKRSSASGADPRPVEAGWRPTLPPTRTARYGVARRAGSVLGIRDSVVALQVVPAGRFDVLARDPPPFVRQQGGDDLADVVALPQAPERGARDERGNDLGEALERVVGDPSPGRAGGHRIDTDPAPAELLRHVSREHRETALHAGVGRVAGL